jgi:tetratricopeptide (TPR) repeat protein
VTLLLALQLFSPVDPADVARLHEQRIAREPDSKAAKRDYGLFLLRNGQAPLAEMYLRQSDVEPVYLAEAVAAQGRDAEATKIFETCATTARCLTRLANLAEKREDMPAALALYKRALEKDPSIARRSDHALALQAALEYKEAERELRAALAECEKVHGPNHPETATLLNNIAMLMGETKRPALARPLLQRAIKIFEQTLGPRHARTRIARENLEDLR